MGEETLPAFLRAAMRRREWKQGELARRVGVSSGRMSEWLAGKRRPSPASCDRIADALGADPAEVLRLAGHLPAPPPDDPVKAELLAMLAQTDLTPEWEETVRATLEAARRGSEAMRPRRTPARPPRRPAGAARPAR